MNGEAKNHTTSQDAEPTCTPATVPMWLVSGMLVLLFLGAWYFDVYGGWFDPKVYEPYKSITELAKYQPPATDENPLFGRGRTVYTATCAPCHQPTGLGSAAVGAPPLVDSEWVLAEGPNRMIRIVLHGLAGPITVKGQDYGTGVMTPLGSALSNEDVAAVLTYIRQNKEWKHNAEAVTPEQVAAVREATKDRPVNWTASELLNIPVK